MREPGEVILTMRPLVCRLIISLATPKVSATRPVTLTAKVRCQSASDMLLKASASPIAAQFTKMSMRPNCLTVSCTICAVLPEEVRSAGIDSSGPAWGAHEARPVDVDQHHGQFALRQRRGELAPESRRRACDYRTSWVFHRSSTLWLRTCLYETAAPTAGAASFP